MRTSVKPAYIRAIQKHQRQPIVGALKPETIGAKMGPKVVAYIEREEERRVKCKRYDVLVFF